MAEPVTRREYLFLAALIEGAGPLFASEAVSSTALAHEPGWLDVLVDPDTGEEVPRR